MLIVLIEKIFHISIMACLEDTNSLVTRAVFALTVPGLSVLFLQIHGLSVGK